ncbi:aspartyl/asparaginyl beta-hydroxylase domain-containing protein [Pseudoalteromonas piscicida]|uniref:sulfotransferase n=1 Tax=Pseudoalteromonas piscicida TaxID=43662 RepID=UPI002738DB7B|nr:aspartyl/asparaginyl beta-hydroxylase domain-containing protein [Pseudoalteromonas piscicida]MDP4486389.1 aspartyl/asparaginyl beta-hydroxylase domain-containing protein [Pseudoalteromonas piscicida]
MRLTKPLLTVGHVDISNLCSVIDALAESHWQENTYRQTSYEVHKQTNSIVLLFKSGSYTEVNEPLLKVFQPLLAPIFARFAQYYGYHKLDISKIMFARLPAGNSISKHYDSDPMFARYHRVHVPLKTNSLVDFYIEDNTYSLKAGIIYELNNLALHGVLNSSQEDRIHLIFDARPIKRIAQATTHLFILSPNNSGSTLLSNTLAAGKNVLSLPTEGQYLPEFIGPNPAHDASMYVWSQFNTLNRLTDPRSYNWPAIRKGWSNCVTQPQNGANLFIEKSPCNIARMNMLIEEFDNAKFIFLVRNPIATFESIIRGRADLYNIEQLAVDHIIWCFMQQKQNIESCAAPYLLIHYEAICDNPTIISKQLAEFEPTLDSVDFSTIHNVKGRTSPLVNFNNQQMESLSEAQLAFAIEAFTPYAALFAYFDYELLV